MAFEKRPKLRWLTEHVGYEGDDCLIFPFALSQGGYGSFCAGSKITAAHRWMCEQTKGPAPSPEHHAAHSCGRGDQGCVNPNHLSWKTNAENQIDRRAHGTSKNGPGTRWKLTPENVAEIRAQQGKEAIKSLADRFGVKDATIRQIHSGRIWRTGDYAPGGFNSETGKAASHIAHGVAD